jgi:hypothetical protein
VKLVRRHATEHQEQMALIAWAQTVHFSGHRLADWIVMIPNESLMSSIPAGPRRYAYWNKLLKLGFRKGASDLLLAVPTGGFSGLWIEMKRRREAFPGKAELGRAVKADQGAFMRQMDSVGYRTAVAYGWEEARVFVRAYIATAGRAAA